MIHAISAIRLRWGALAVAAIVAPLLPGCAGPAPAARVTPAPSAPRPKPGAGALDGVWLAHGQVDVSRGTIPLRQGDVIERVWQFRRTCRSGRCALYWTRLVDGGTFRAKVHLHGNALTATFVNEPIPCFFPGGPHYNGLLSSTFTLRLLPNRTLVGSERTYVTTRACRGIFHAIRWTATPGSGTPDIGVPAQRLNA